MENEDTKTPDPRGDIKGIDEQMAETERRLREIDRTSTELDIRLARLRKRDGDPPAEIAVHSRTAAMLLREGAATRCPAGSVPGLRYTGDGPLRGSALWINDRLAEGAAYLREPPMPLAPEGIVRDKVDGTAVFSHYDLLPLSFTAQFLKPGQDELAFLEQRNILERTRYTFIMHAHPPAPTASAKGGLE